VTEPAPPPPPRGPDDPTIVQGPVEPVEPVPQRRVIVDEAPPSRNWWPWVALLFAIAAAVFFVLWLTNRGGANTNSVPNLTGMSEQQARTEADASGFEVKTVRRSGSGPAGNVLDQGPSPGVELQKGAQVLIVVSSGAPTTVPSVVGMKVDQAKNTLTTAKLTPKVQNVESDTPADTVVAQNPAGGATAAANSEVVLSVSKGPPMVAVPSLVGLSLQNATEKLADDGLAVRVIPVSSSKSRGTVIAQDPSGGQKVKKGSAVRINVSEGPPTTATGETTTVTVTVTTLTDTTAIP
jgi:beta-lactam-binding protein with PASTA domain